MKNRNEDRGLLDEIQLLLYYFIVGQAEMCITFWLKKNVTD